MTYQDVFAAVIGGEHGWAVKEQFESTFSDVSEESFSNQNLNALEYIRICVKEMLDSDAFSSQAVEELENYYYALVEYLEEAGA